VKCGIGAVPCGRVLMFVTRAVAGHQRGLLVQCGRPPMCGTGIEVPCGSVSMRLNGSFERCMRVHPGLLCGLGTGSDARRQLGSALSQFADPSSSGLPTRHGCLPACGTRFSNCHQKILRSSAPIALPSVQRFQHVGNRPSLL
jgi:hypothetical protein